MLQILEPNIVTTCILLEEGFTNSSPKYVLTGYRGAWVSLRELVHGQGSHDAPGDARLGLASTRGLSGLRVPASIGWHKCLKLPL